MNKPEYKVNQTGEMAAGTTLRCQAPRSRTLAGILVDRALLGAVLAIPWIALVSAPNPHCVSSVLILLGIGLLYGQWHEQIHWGVAFLLCWGGLSFLEQLSVPVRLGSLSLSLQIFFLILLSLLMAANVIANPPSLWGIRILAFAAFLFLLFLLPAAAVSGALTLQTPLILIESAIFILLLEPVSRNLKWAHTRPILTAYGVILAIFSVVRWIWGGA